MNKLSGMCIRVFGLFFINPDSSFNRFFFLKTTFLEVILSAELGIPSSSELHAFLSAVSGGSEWLTMLESVFSGFATTKKKSQDALFFRLIFPGASWGAGGLSSRKICSCEVWCSGGEMFAIVSCVIVCPKCASPAQVFYSPVSGE